MHGKILHLLCTAGSCRLHFSGREHTLEAGCCMIAMESHVSDIRPSADCRLLRLVSPAEVQVSYMPRNSYGTCGWLHLFMHPIFRVPDEVFPIVAYDFEDVIFRSENTPLAYREEAVHGSMRALYLDVMNAHASMFAHEEVTQRAADIMSRFIRMLEQGSYRRHRAVAYYAQQLCVSPKHLHKISAQVSGRAPSYWIRQFTLMEIRHLLRYGRLTAKEVADKMNFDSAAHFSRYVRREVSATRSEG